MKNTSSTKQDTKAKDFDSPDFVHTAENHNLIIGQTYVNDANNAIATITGKCNKVGTTIYPALVCILSTECQQTASISDGFIGFENNRSWRLLTDEVTIIGKDCVGIVYKKKSGKSGKSAAVKKSAKKS